MTDAMMEDELIVWFLGFLVGLAIINIYLYWLSNHKDD